MWKETDYRLEVLDLEETPRVYVRMLCCYVAVLHSFFYFTFFNLRTGRE